MHAHTHAHIHTGLVELAVFSEVTSGWDMKLYYAP